MFMPSLAIGRMNPQNAKLARRLNQTRQWVGTQNKTKLGAH